MKHISSFIGNVGDILSNHAFSNYLASKGVVDYEKVEIRHFYKNIPESLRLSFDSVFEECQSNNETLIIGGGGFLDYWVEDSRTATTIDVSLDILSNTDFKLVISSIGSFPHKSVTVKNLEKFIQFMKILSCRKNTYVMLRNDGSFNELSTVLPSSVMEGLYDGADNAYLTEIETFKKYEVDKNYIALNIASDQLYMKSKHREAIDVHNFKKQILITINFIVRSLGKKVVLVPHLLSDVQFYVELCLELDDLLVREHVTIFTYSGQEKDIRKYIDIYSNSYANVCTRLHANILSAILDKKTISLSVLDRVRYIASQHENLYEITDFKGNFSEVVNAILYENKYLNNSVRYYEELDNFYSKIL